MQVHAQPSQSLPSQVSTHQAAIQNFRSHPRDELKTAIDMDCLDQFYEFCPSDARLIDAYLRPKIAGNYVNRGCIHDADVTSDHPYELARKHAPAPGTVAGGGNKGKGVWFFFSPVRYAAGGGGKAARSRKKNRARTVLGAADGRKKGTWHAEGKRTAVAGTAGGYFQKLSYHEVTPSGSAVAKPGRWLMVEYAIDEDHGGGGGGGALVLCKVYRSPRGGPAGPGGSSDVSSSSSSCKRKACGGGGGVEQPDDDVGQVVLHHRPCKKRTQEEDVFSAANNLMRHDDLDLTTATDYYAPAAYRETEQILGTSGESAAAADQLTWRKAEPDQVPDEGFPQPQPQIQDQEDPPCAADQKEDEDDDDVVEISFKDFTASSSSAAALASAAPPPPPPPPPCAAQPKDDDVVSLVEMSSKQEVVQLPADEGEDDDGDKIEFTFEELMGSSTPAGQCSSSMSSFLLPTEDDDDNDAAMDMCGLACPPMDYAIVEALVKLGPDIVGEESFICDL